MPRGISVPCVPEAFCTINFRFLFGCEPRNGCGLYGWMSTPRYSRVHQGTLFTRGLCISSQFFVSFRAHCTTGGSHTYTISSPPPLSFFATKKRETVLNTERVSPPPPTLTQFSDNKTNKKQRSPFFLNLPSLLSPRSPPFSLPLYHLTQQAPCYTLCIFTLGHIAPEVDLLPLAKKGKALNSSFCFFVFWW